jgi:hypothetical protein
MSVRTISHFDHSKRKQSESNGRKTNKTLLIPHWVSFFLIYRAALSAWIPFTREAGYEWSKWTMK